MAIFSLTSLFSIISRSYCKIRTKVTFFLFLYLVPIAQFHWLFLHNNYRSILIVAIFFHLNLRTKLNIFFSNIYRKTITIENLPKKDEEVTFVRIAEKNLQLLSI